MGPRALDDVSHENALDDATTTATVDLSAAIDKSKGLKVLAWTNATSKAIVSMMLCAGVRCEPQMFLTAS